jgi:hypothetical protein
MMRTCEDAIIFVVVHLLPSIYRRFWVVQPFFCIDTRVHDQTNGSYHTKKVGITSCVQKNLVDFQSFEKMQIYEKKQYWLFDRSCL